MRTNPIKALLMTVLFSLAVLGCPTNVPDTTDPDLPDDPDIDMGESPASELDGVWKGKSWQLGAALDDASDYVETVTFVGNTLEMIAFSDNRQRAYLSGIYAVGSATEFPKPIDMNVYSSSTGRTGLNMGLYTLQGDTLYLSFGGFGNERALNSSLFPSVGPVFVGTKQTTAKTAEPEVSGLLGGAID